MGIEAILSKQFFVCSLFDDFPLVQNDHFFRPLRNGQAMGDENKGKVIDCVQTGYTMNDEVIRHAKVAVGQ